MSTACSVWQIHLLWDAGSSHESAEPLGFSFALVIELQASGGPRGLPNVSQHDNQKTQTGAVGQATFSLRFIGEYVRKESSGLVTGCHMLRGGKSLSEARPRCLKAAPGLWGHATSPGSVLGRLLFPLPSAQLFSVTSSLRWPSVLCQTAESNLCG